jgi:KTSC domain
LPSALRRAERLIPDFATLIRATGVVMPTVVSSAIARIEYDGLSHELQITFVTGNTYVYEGVPHAVYERFLEAESKGSFFNATIRDDYPFRHTRRA